MKTALFLSEYDLSTVHYLCSYYIDNANLDKEDIDYINELQGRVEKLMEVKWKLKWTKNNLKFLSMPYYGMSVMIRKKREYAKS